ncbi:Aste57867_22084 [Aphanomyces stellatus]|uniref:COMM domain-containing protein 6 n=1 Tax=Aphanomyces stellatus TaxID=120398 RepID=A0A485LJI5_9STRA|nr:hypothetical protein As57867_022015 [Aphanomyces stellatus]VFT98752.1 Aste57867_22084 [Aphanomyces stellatus]
MASNVNAMPEPMLVEFASMMFLYCVSPQDHDLTKLAADFAAQHQMNMKPLKKTIQHVFELINQAIQLSYPASEFVQHLTRAGMEMAPAKILGIKWEACRPVLLQRVHQVMLATHQLVNLTWKLGITAATNQVPEHGAIFVQLSFELDTGAPTTATESIELSVENFYRFLANMEALQAHMLFLQR